MAFHPYPQVIRWLCNANRFGPPAGVTPPSPWPWVAHPVSGLLPATSRPVRTRFRYGSGCDCLNLATESNSPAHSPKGTPSGLPGSLPGIALRLLVGTRFQVLFHSPHRGAFHLSLTVLVHYRSPRVFSLGWWSTQLPTGFHVPRGTRGHRRETGRFSRTGLSPSTAGLSRTIPLSAGFVTPWDCRRVPSRAPQPPYSIGRRATKLYGFGLLPFRSPLLRESFLFLGVLRCFSSPGSPRRPMDSAGDAWAFPHAGFPIRVSWDQHLLAAPPGLSQPATPFFGPWCQGIHRVPLVASFTQDGRNHLLPHPIQLLRYQPQRVSSESKGVKALIIYRGTRQRCPCRTSNPLG